MKMSFRLAFSPLAEVWNPFSAGIYLGTYEVVEDVDLATCESGIGRAVATFLG